MTMVVKSPSKIKIYIYFTMAFKWKILENIYKNKTEDITLLRFHFGEIRASLKIFSVKCNKLFVVRSRTRTIENV